MLRDSYLKQLGYPEVPTGFGEPRANGYGLSKLKARERENGKKSSKKAGERNPKTPTRSDMQLFIPRQLGQDMPLDLLVKRNDLLLDLQTGHRDQAIARVLAMVLEGSVFVLDAAQV